MDLPDVIDPLCIVVSRDQVESGDASEVLKTLKGFLASPAKAKSFQERLDIAFHGYDDDRRELFEIPTVREFVYKLDEGFPFWLFFLSKQHLGLQCILHCFLLPFLTGEARAKTHPNQLGELLTHRWFPAMNQVCQFAGLTETENRLLTERSTQYFMNGLLPYPEQN
jgi:hypothetical protein